MGRPFLDHDFRQATLEFMRPDRGPWPRCDLCGADARAVLGESCPRTLAEPLKGPHATEEWTFRLALLAMAPKRMLEA